MNGPLFEATIVDSCPLREYQSRAIEMLRKSLRSGKKRPLLQLPTGAGKTRIASEIIREVCARHKRAIFVVPRLSLIEQTVASFEREGISHVGVIQGRNYRTDPAAKVQVASADTLVRREIPDAAIVIIDEAHIKHGKIQKWMAASECTFIGLTA